MKFFEAVANVFRIPDLRNRVLFTLAHAGRVPPGRVISRLRALTRTGWQEFFSRTRARCSDSSICSAAACSAG